MKLKEFLKVYDNNFKFDIELFSRHLFKVYKYSYDKNDELLKIFSEAEIEEFSFDPYLKIVEITVY